MTVCTDRPYNDLPPIPRRERLETTATLKHAVNAARELAELRGAGPLIPDQTILLRAILLQEARASSEIENVVTTNDALYRAFDNDPEHSDPQTREVLRYGEALWSGHTQITDGRPISPSLIVNLVHILKGASIGIRTDDGCRIVNDRTGEVVYTPPVGKERILRLLDGLCEFLATDNEIEPLIKMAAAHRQFEAIHPFPDGNGRTGRVLNILYLQQSGLLDLPILYLSHAIVRHKSTYYQLLREVTEKGAWEAWIIFMLNAIEETARMTKAMLGRVHQAVEEAADQARLEMSKGYSRELINLVFRQPYTRISHVAIAGLANRNTASTYLRELAAIGILVPLRFGREVLYYNPELSGALTQDYPN